MVYYLADGALPPADWPSFWEWAEEALSFVEGDLYGLDFETREDAIAGRYAKSLDPNDLRLDSSHVIRFRETDDRDNLFHFYELGRATLPIVADGIEQRSWSPALAHQWAVLMFCHGFVMSSAFARGDDQQSRRAGLAGGAKVSRDAQDRWFARRFLAEQARGLDRRDAEDLIERVVLEAEAGRIEAVADWREWFAKMLNKQKDSLSNRYRQKAFSVLKMRDLAVGPADDLPPIDLFVPKP